MSRDKGRDGRNMGRGMGQSMGQGSWDMGDGGSGHCYRNDDGVGRGSFKGECFFCRRWGLGPQGAPLPGTRARVAGAEVAVVTAGAEAAGLAAGAEAAVVATGAEAAVVATGVAAESTRCLRAVAATATRVTTGLQSQICRGGTSRSRSSGSGSSSSLQGCSMSRRSSAQVHVCGSEAACCIVWMPGIRLDRVVHA